MSKKVLTQRPQGLWDHRSPHGGPRLWQRCFAPRPWLPDSALAGGRRAGPWLDVLASARPACTWRCRWTSRLPRGLLGFGKQARMRRNAKEKRFLPDTAFLPFGSLRIVGAFTEFPSQICGLGGRNGKAIRISPGCVRVCLLGKWSVPGLDGRRR